ncbi:MAG: ribosome maturation factor RimM [Pseudomonadota bacterium]
MAEQSRSAMVVMGRVAGAYGVRGWIKVQPYTESVQNLAEYGRWWIGSAGNWQEWKVLQAKVHGATVLAKLEGLDVRETAALLKGREVAVPREAMPPTAEDEHYWTDLIGLEVVNLQGEVLGKVAGHFSNGAHDIMRVARDEAEQLIPYVGAVIREVDLPGRRIVVDWGADW